MTLDQLETFVQVVTSPQFLARGHSPGPGAADSLGRIGQLESELGSRLFVRHGHTLELTESGRSFLPYAERILGLRSEGLAMVQRINRGGLAGSPWERTLLAASTWCRG